MWGNVHPIYSSSFYLGTVLPKVEEEKSRYQSWNKNYSSTLVFTFDMNILRLYIECIKCVLSSLVVPEILIILAAFKDWRRG